MGTKESALSQVAAGDRLSGAQGRLRLINSNVETEASRPGKAVQIAGGSGANCAMGTAKTAAQNAKAQSCARESEPFPMRHRATRRIGTDRN